MLPLLLLLAAQAPVPMPAPALVLRGEGVQVYRCAGAAGGWVLDHPEAKLLDASGAVVGSHGAGPSWQYKDGSLVRGEAVEKTPSPDPASVPWLVVRVTAHQGAGVLGEVNTVRRTETHGGVAPPSGCGAAHPAAAAVRVPYTATYSFYR